MLLQITPSEATSLGSAGLLIYLVIKEVLAFSAKKGNGKKVGEMDPASLELLIIRIVEKETAESKEERQHLIDMSEKILEKLNDTNFVIAKMLMRGVKPSPNIDDE